MYRRGLKIHIIIDLAILLAISMLLIAFVMLGIERNNLLKQEISKGYLLISSIQSILRQTPTGLAKISSREKGEIRRLMSEAKASCVAVFEQNLNQTYMDGNDCSIAQYLDQNASDSITSKEIATGFAGSTWDFLWAQNKYALISVPFIEKAAVSGCISIAVSLENIYQTLRDSRQVLVVYFFINICVLTVLGFFRFHKIFIRPINKLMARTETFTAEEFLSFFPEKKDNEFGMLSRSLNQMLHRINQDKIRLRSTVNSLEQTNQELRKAQNEIICAEKLASIGRLSAGIAHEIGNPIGIVLGYFDLLKQDNLEDGQKKDFIRRAENEINRINVIIRQLLDFSRSSDDVIQSVSVHTVIEDVKNILSIQPLTASIGIELSLTAESDIIAADPNQLRQVFINLMINASDAIAAVKDKADGIIVIKTEIEASSNQKNLTILFSDNGPGIDEELLGVIFDPFYTTKEPGKGTGLGLSICYMIIDSLGGRIRAESAPGKGTTFTIHLPLPDTQEKRQKQEFRNIS